MQPKSVFFHYAKSNNLWARPWPDSSLVPTLEPKWILVACLSYWLIPVAAILIIEMKMWSRYFLVPMDRSAADVWCAVTTMVCTKTINYRLSLFFNLSFTANKWGTKNKKSIFFNICQIFAFLKRFFKIPYCHSLISLWKMAKFWEKIKKSLIQNFFSAIYTNLQ